MITDIQSESTRKGGGGGGLFRYNHDRKGERLLLGLEIFAMTLCGGKILVTLASLGWTKSWALQIYKKMGVLDQRGAYFIFSQILVRYDQF